MRRFVLILSLILPLIAIAIGCRARVRAPKVANNQNSVSQEHVEVREHLTQIIMAMHSYDLDKHSFPNDSVDPQSGRLLLSWRVHLLPYLGENNLYQSFNLNEPWDGPTNSQLVNRMPKVFAATGAKARAGETYYRGFAGEGASAGIFEIGKKIRIFDIQDGASNTIAVIDAGEPVIWTKPGSDLPISPNAPLPKLGGMSDGNFLCALCDGSVKRIRRDFDESEMRAAISRKGGEVSLGTNVFSKE